MAYWTVIGTGSPSDTAAGKTFGITLDTSNKTWIANGPHVDLFVSEKSGSYKIIADPVFGHGTQLAGSGSTEQAFCENLNGTTAVGATGPGRSKALFTWKLDSK